MLKGWKNSFNDTFICRRLAGPKLLISIPVIGTDHDGPQAECSELGQSPKRPARADSPRPSWAATTAPRTDRGLQNRGPCGGWDPSHTHEPCLISQVHPRQGTPAPPRGGIRTTQALCGNCPGRHGWEIPLPATFAEIAGDLDEYRPTVAVDPGFSHTGSWLPADAKSKKATETFHARSNCLTV